MLVRQKQSVVLYKRYRDFLCMFEMQITPNTLFYIQFCEKYVICMENILCRWLDIARLNIQEILYWNHIIDVQEDKWFMYF